MSTCAICTDPLQSQCQLDSCEHVFCFECILRWTQTSSTCPLCKRPVTRLFRSGSRRPYSVPQIVQAADYSEDELDRLAAGRASPGSGSLDSSASSSADSADESPRRPRALGYQRNEFVASDDESVSYSENAWEDEDEGEEADYSDDDE